MIKTRNENRNMIINSLKNSKNWKNQFTFFEENDLLKPSWFGLPLLINNKFIKSKKKYLRYLESMDVETRPIIGGNFTNQPSVKLFKFKFNSNNLKNSQEIEERGFFIGLPTNKLKKSNLNTLTRILLSLK